MCRLIFKRIANVLCLALLFSVSFIARAQESNLGNWAMYFGNIPLNEKWNIHAETQYRNFNAVGDLEQFVLRGGIGYNISTNNHNVLAGYAHFWHEPYIAGTDDKRNFNEHRIWQQFIYRDRIGRVFLQHRYRFEQRFFEGNEQYRLRYFLSLNIPVTKKTMEKNAVYASVYNEIFVKLDAPFFDRNRFYLAAGYVLHPDLRLELGWMNQAVLAADAGRLNNRPQFQIAIFHTIRSLQGD
jgi:hypothetical protein